MRDASRQKLSYNEKRELEGMEATVLEAEGRVTELQSRAQKAGDPEELNRIYAELNDAQSEVERLYERWAKLDEMS